MILADIVVELSNEDAALFVQFRKHQDIFRTLLENGVFATRNGKAILNFNADGVLTRITYDTVGWERKAQ